MNISWNSSSINGPRLNNACIRVWCLQVKGAIFTSEEIYQNPKPPLSSKGELFETLISTLIKDRNRTLRSEAKNPRSASEGARALLLFVAGKEAARVVESELENRSEGFGVGGVLSFYRIQFGFALLIRNGLGKVR